MKRKLLFTLFALLTISSAAWAVSDSWEVTQGDGTVKYTVITEPSGSNGTVSISKGSTNPTGALSIPTTVKNGDKTYTVTEFGTFAFSVCSGLTSVTIPNSVTTIDSYAFDACSGLTSVTIGDNVTTIGYRAFYSCSGLTSITLPESITTIETEAFMGCVSLTSINIPDGVTTIGKRAFGNCALKSVTIPDKVTIIETGMFYGCKSLTSIIIPDKVEEINLQAFWGCTTLTSVTIGSSVKTIGKQAFGNCYALASITSKNTTPPTVEEDAFKNIAVNGTIYVPRESIEAYKSAWGIHIATAEFKAIPAVVNNGSYDLSYEITNDTEGSRTVMLLGLAAGETGRAADLIIPEAVEIDGKTYTVTAIASKAFDGKGGGFAGSLVISDNVATIGEYAFQYCDSLTSITIGSGVTAIERYVFASCRRVANITIGRSVKTIGQAAFLNCNIELDSIIIPDSVETISALAFESCTNLEEITLGSGLKTIAKDAFKNSSVIRDITSKATMPPTIETGAFETSIEKHAVAYVHYQNLANYQSADWWKDLTRGVRAIPITVNNGSYDLSYEVTSNADGNRTAMILGLAESEVDGAVDLVIPDAVTIDGNTYRVTAIGDQAFDVRSDLTGILTIGANVETINSEAFYSSNALTGIICMPTNPPVAAEETNAFKNMTALTGVYVPRASIEDYKNATGEWAKIDDAMFKPLTYAVSAKANANGSAIVTPSGTDVLFNTAVTFTATAENPDYAFEKWTDDNNADATVSTDAVYTVKLGGAMALTAHFKPMLEEVRRAKQTAINDIADDYDESDYHSEQWEELEELFDNARTAVTNATTVEAVNAISLVTLKTSADAIPTAEELAATIARMKTEKIDAINKLFDDYNEADYRPEQWEDLTEIFTDAKKAVSEAKTVEQVNKVDLDKLKADTDAIPTDAEMTAATQAAFNEAKAALQAAIDAAEDKRAEDDYETQYTSDSRRMVSIAIANGKISLDRYGNSTESLVISTKYMQYATEAIYSALAGLVEESPVGVESVEGNEPFVRVGNTLRFAAPTEIAVYSTSGRMMYAGTTEEYTLPETDGIYILRTADGSWKLVRR